ncbi:MAG: flagellar export protein FliJ [Candidatus Sericytochromatia bacterium]|nr:flagellar export protein FliJ [Candidatus Tanganyikabacteria bacterium]
MADKFQYRLGKVLTLREKKEDKLKRDKAAAERERDRERDALDELQARLVAAKRAIGSSLSAGQTANVQMGNDYASSLEKKIEEQEKKLKAAQQKVDDLEKALTLATRDVKILEKHREKSRDRWKAELDRKEAITLNEMATQGYLKRVNRQNEEDQEEEARLAALAAEEAMAQSAWISGLMQSSEAEARRRPKPEKKQV